MKNALKRDFMENTSINRDDDDCKKSQFFSAKKREGKVEKVPHSAANENRGHTLSDVL